MTPSSFAAISTQTQAPRSPATSDSTLKLEYGFRLASLTTLFATPALLLVPPRKLDLYTLSLCGAFVIAANHQTRLRTGDSILLWLGRQRGLAGDRCAEEDTEFSSQMAPSSCSKVVADASSRQRCLNASLSTRINVWDMWAEQPSALLGADGQEIRRLKQRTSVPSRDAINDEGSFESGSLLEAADVLRQKSITRHQLRERGGRHELEGTSATDDGRGIGQLIMEQVWEVCNWNSAAKDLSESGSEV